MAEREKVIDGLMCLAGEKEMHINHCDGCGYNECKSYVLCIAEIARDALSLLKAQEPIPCGERIKAGDIVLDFYECGYCKNAIRKPWRYCPFCGKAVKWDE